MNPPFWPRLGGTFAIGIAALVADKSAATEPPVVVIPAAYTEPTPPEPEIERFHGTVKVNPPAPPAPALRPPMVVMTPPVEPPIVQVEARNVQPMLPPMPPDTRVSDAVVDTLQTVREDTRRVSTAAAVLLGQVGGWLKAPPAEPRAIFPSFPITINNPAPTVLPPQQTLYPQIQPWMTTLPSAPVPPVIAQVSATTQQPQLPPPQPTIIVLREPAAPVPILAPAQAAPVVAAPAPAPVAEPARGLESYFGFGVGIVGLGIGLMSWLRSSRQKRAETATPASASFPTPEAPPRDGVILAGGLYAGPRPELAEPFDLGPSYEDEQNEKKRLEAENQNAVLEFILNQNLALQAAFAGPAVDEAPSESIGETPVAD
ncbi:MAG: hypothetical protein K8U57_36520 [Planctomycetes bacterium]|nr:hypothetical protein [Planctomycetota bacterium]